MAEVNSRLQTFVKKTVLLQPRGFTNAPTSIKITQILSRSYICQTMSQLEISL